tara:strand:+ start:357 stop:839 length:483 start_codon:yes stop_codon:yes gene_type:complete
MRIIAYIDGACSGNPGPGGWGLYLKAENKNGKILKIKELYGKDPHTTNNKMELTAAIKSLKNLEKESGVIITIRTDSQYVRKGITEWLSKWKNNNWRTSNKKPVANQELWQELDSMVSRHLVNWEWVKGHAGDSGNEKADELAVRGRDEAVKDIADNTNN